MKTIVSPDVEHAAQIIQKGGIVIFPTETVYGIGANSRNLTSCSQIYKIKNRPTDNPFIVHLDHVDSMYELAKIPKKYKKILEQFSPGPITYIFEKKDETIFSSGLSTIALRVPLHPLTNDFLKSAGVPVSAPSANLSGKPSITRASDAISEFSDKVDFILTGSDSEIGVESTVLDLSGEHPTLVRPGKISFFELKKYIPELKKFEMDNSNATKPISPGIKYRHYAPNCKVTLVDNIKDLKGDSIGFIGFSETDKVNFFLKINDNLEYMHYLYSFFIDCDKHNIQQAYCEIPREDEFQEVLLNRIEKAILK